MLQKLCRSFLWKCVVGLFLSKQAAAAQHTPSDTSLSPEDSYRAAELDLGCKVQQLQWPMSPLQFYRDFVSKNKPCLLTGEALVAALQRHAVVAMSCGNNSFVQESLMTGLPCLCGTKSTSHTSFKTKRCLCMEHGKVCTYSAACMEFAGDCSSHTKRQSRCRLQH